jgi:hypothetical protein
MKYNSYAEYVTDAETYFSKKDLKVPVKSMILPEALFNNFNGIIEFGPGSKNMVNKCDGNCKCEVKCENHKD